MRRGSDKLLFFLCSSKTKTKIISKKKKANPKIIKTKITAHLMVNNFPEILERISKCMSAQMQDLKQKYNWVTLSFYTLFFPKLIVCKVCYIHFADENKARIRIWGLDNSTGLGDSGNWPLPFHLHMYVGLYVCMCVCFFSQCLTIPLLIVI